MRFNKSIIFIFAIFFEVLNSYSQNKYWVFFIDKRGVKYNPYEYLDSNAIQRRIKNNISLYDSSDFPLNSSYVQSVVTFSDSLFIQSRWFNAVVVSINDKNVEVVRKLSFVKEVIKAPEQKAVLAGNEKFDDNLTEGELRQMQIQLSSMQGEKYSANNITGKGVRIAIFDAGFPSVDVNPAFEHIRKDNRIIKTYDFVKKTDRVYDHSTHGTMVFSCIAGVCGNKKMGLATGAEFLLARTEYGVREPYAEEEYWLAAAEWADKNGADIINSSLGYTYHRYFVEEMNGKSFVAKAANMAARKGILVVNAAGNEGAGEWKTIITPADADSVLAVGGVNPTSFIHTSFSSFGPSYDKRLKPNVCAMGHVIASSPGKLKETQGTSFASPLVAGFAACALQTRPSLKAMELFKEIEKSGSLYPYYDYAHGYGIPQASYFTDEVKNKNFECPFEIVLVENLLEIRFKASYIENELNTSDSLLYYHIENPTGYLDKYVVVKIHSNTPVKIALNGYEKQSTVRVRFDKWIQTFKWD